MDDPIPSLRDDYSRDDQEYPRPDLTADEEKKYLQVAANLANLQNARQRAAYVAALVYENVRLLKEVNEHRAARGYELLPVYDPVIK